jgi:Domain of unknown function (DUF6438)
MHFPHAVLSALGAMMMVACAPVDAAPQSSGPVSITLTRSVCFGFCPAYSVTITGDGAVTYVGQSFVNVVGEQHASVPRAEVQALLARFDAVNFETLNDAYRSRVTDIPTYTVSLERNGRRKTVVDYGGVGAGMPRAVRDLEDEIDRVAHTSRWILRDGQPVRTPAPQP